MLAYGSQAGICRLAVNTIEQKGNSMKNIISLGAGVQSSTMALMAAKGEITPMPDAAIFADTMVEPDSVYKWLDWLELQLPFKVYRVSFGDLSKEIEKIPLFMRKKNKVVMGMRKCTTEYKIQPVSKKMRELCGLAKHKKSKQPVASQWVGISTDEASRMQDSKLVWMEKRYPLIEKNMTRTNCLNWMTKNNYPSPPKSACLFCPYTDDKRWRNMKKYAPETFKQAMLYDRMVRKSNPEFDSFIHRSAIPLEDIDFRTLEDMGQINMFENDCSGSCGV